MSIPFYTTLESVYEMKRLTINKEISIKWLTRELQAAGVAVSGAGIERTGEGEFISAYVEIAEADEAAAMVVIAAHDPQNNPDVLEKADLGSLEADIAGELVWLADTLATIDTMTNTQVRNVVKRLLQEQQRELKAWRYVIRRLK